MMNKTRVYLIDAYLDVENEFEHELRLNDTLSLLRTLEYELAEYHPFRLNKIESTTYINKGSLDIVKDEIEHLDDDNLKIVLTFDASASQIKNLSNYLGKEVIDRVELIVSIFSLHAKSKEAKIQVELAKISYRLSSLVQSDLDYEQDTSSGRGYTATRGAGEKQIVLDRRLLQQRRDNLLRQLKQIKSNREIRRRKRLDSIYPIVALVGYTNAGKSSLMNALLKLSKKERKNVTVENKLFTTLDTSTRLIEIKGYPSFILIDTVGIVENLPIELVKAFRSTYEEALNSHLLINVLDISSSYYLEQKRSAEKMINELCIEHLPLIHCYNKIDQFYGNFPTNSDKNDIFISTFNDDDIHALLRLISDNITKDYPFVTLNLPYEIPYFKFERFAEVKKAIMKDEGIYIEAKLNPTLINVFRPYLLSLDGHDIN